MRLVRNLCSSTNTPKQIGILFPGQGSQFVGMMPNALESEIGKKILNNASEILGYDMKDLIEKGPKEKLDNTEFCQPAIFTCSLVAFEHFKLENADLINNAKMHYLGLSLGEYTALCASGLLSFEQGLKLVQVRATEMRKAGETQNGGMMTIVGLSDDILENMCSKWRAKDQKNVMDIANYLYPKCRVVSGDVAGLDFMEKLAKEENASKTIKTAVSGAFHTSMMGSASEQLIKEIETCTLEPEKTNGIVHSNFLGKPYPEFSNKTLTELLSKQLVCPLKFEDSLKQLTTLENATYYEMGPGKQITAMLVRINRRKARNCNTTFTFIKM